jgi:hypothetical protein
MLSEIVTNKYFFCATHFITNLQKKTTMFRKNQVLHIADINVREIFFAYILVCWSYENGKNLPAQLNLTKSVNVVHPNMYGFLILYMRKCPNFKSYVGRPLVINDFATAPFGIS